MLITDLFAILLFAAAGLRSGTVADRRLAAHRPAGRPAACFSFLCGVAVVVALTQLLGQLH